MAEAALRIPARPEVAGVSAAPSPEPRHVLSAPPGRSPLSCCGRERGVPAAPLRLHPSGAPSAAFSGDKGSASTGSENQLPERVEKKIKSLPCMLNCVRGRGGEAS